MEQIIKKKSKDKISLSSKNVTKLDMWLSQFDKWNEIISVTKSDLVNFILEKSDEILSSSELKILLKSLVNQSEKPKIRKPRQKKIVLKANAVETSSEKLS